METDQNISIDKLEDQLIDHPDPSTAKQLSELSYDETFQRKLNERAEQMFAGSESGDDSHPGANLYLFLVTKPYLRYQHRDFNELDEELSEWFVSLDYQLIGLNALPERAASFSIHQRPELFEGPSLDSLVYYVLGEFTTGVSKEKQLGRIRRNCSSIVDTYLLEPILSSLVKALKDTIARKPLSTDHLLKLLTVTYFIVCNELTRNPSTSILNVFSRHDLLSELVVYTEEWKLSPSNSFRIRNVILLIWKLVLLEFGDSKRLDKVKSYLNRKHDIKDKNSGDSSNRLTCSPLEYYAFREDLLDKYPAFSKQEKAIPQDLRESPPKNGVIADETHQKFMAASSTGSLSNLLEMPRTNKAHSVLGQLPINTLHIATPVPSPPSTPSDFMAGGEKVRKLYHVNQSMPFIYPNGAEEILPEAIKEANELFVNSVYESYSVKRLWLERKKYMAQERGNRDQYEAESSDEEILDDNDPDAFCKQSLHRVDQFYARSLCHLLSLGKVLVEIVKSYKHEVSLRDIEQELNEETSLTLKFSDGNRASYEAVKQHMLKQLETIRAKEIALKASSSIMVLLLRWFKLSHVVKSYFFNSILFDEQFFNVFTDFMVNSLSNNDLHDFDEEVRSFAPNEVVTSQNKLMNPQIVIPSLDFFNVCGGRSQKEGAIKLINKTPISKFPSSVDDDNQNVVELASFNRNYCHILANLLQVTNKISIKGVSQRIFAIIETKPTDLLKLVLLNYINDDLKIPILKIFKKIIPFQGRKWRAMNMEVISQVFLNLKLTIRDNWLSGRDLESDFNNSIDQEIALRSLLQFYNMRKYPEQMKQLGYTVSSENLAPSTYDDEV